MALTLIIRTNPWVKSDLARFRELDYVHWRRVTAFSSISTIRHLSGLPALGLNVNREIAEELLREVTE
jgi:hypothetical protein